MANSDSCVAIIGGGTMGGDIALIFAAGGWATHIVEPSAMTRKTLPDRLMAGLQTLKAEQAADRFVIHATLEEIPWAAIAFVVECVPEDLHLKQKVFAELEAFSRSHIPLTSNASSFPISQIGKGLATQSRMAGLHFFMPAHIVPLVEVIRSEATDPAVAEEIGAIMRRLGKRPVQVRRDMPGFLANRIQHALMREALSLVENGVATPEDVDAAVRYGFGFRYVAAGPLLQKDFSGIDLHCAAAATIYPDLCNASTPSRDMVEKVAAGHIGIKSKQGFYNWTDEKIATEKARYEKALLGVLEILKT
jgi:3-hydroxybutyryl-CoA dehydrogenase